MDYKRSYNSGGEAPEFNMAVLYLTRLDQRLNERDQARINGNLILWYRCLRSIYGNIFFKIKEAGHEEEEAKINKLFEKAQNYIKANASSNELQNQIDTIAITNIEIILDEIDIMINTLMYGYNLIFPKKRENNPKKAIKEMFHD